MRLIISSELYVTDPRNLWFLKHLFRFCLNWITGCMFHISTRLVALVCWMQVFCVASSPLRFFQSDTKNGVKKPIFVGQVLCVLAKIFFHSLFYLFFFYPEPLLHCDVCLHYGQWHVQFSSLSVPGFFQSSQGSWSLQPLT